MRTEWEMSFAQGGEAALELMKAGGFDVVVSDMRMPGMNGIDLLSEVKQRLPDSVRIVLSGQMDREAVLRSVGCVHQFLTKPCNPEDLRTTIRRALALRAQLSSERLMQVVSRINSLPSVPALHVQIQDALREEKGSIEDVGRIIKNDIGMSAKVLQLVNSSFFGVSQRMTDPVEATVYLGLDTITSLVLTSQVFGLGREFYQPDILERLWTHSLATGSYARTIAKLENMDAKTAERAFMAGMLHEVGYLIMGSELPDELVRALRFSVKFSVPAHAAEHRLLGGSHAAIGAYLLGIWGLPDPVVEAVAFHHTPSECPDERFSIVTAVHVATSLDAGPGGNAVAERENELDLAYLEKLQLTARLPVWREACSQTAERKAA
jgi:HD-like signal output (HDOD) protein